MKGYVVAVAAVVWITAGCGSSGGDSTPNAGGSDPSDAVSGSITVLAAASLTDPFTEIATQFEADHPATTITFSFGASSDLATQVQQGSPADVFASASTKTMDQVGDAATGPQNFATNTMAIATPPGNPAHIATVADLARSGVKVAVCDFEVPCGVVAKAVFDNARVTVDPVAREQDVKATLTVVESGEVDAGVVYVTDVRAAGDKVDGVGIPEDINAVTTYPISPLADSGNPALARAFTDYVLSGAGQRVLRDAGFAPVS